MPSTTSTYELFCSYKSIEDQFIDDCLDTGIRSKQDFIPTGLKFYSQACISIAQIGSEKLLGRWSIEESFAYLEALKHCHHTKNIIRALVERLPKRIESQIRAHHQKMMKKYGSRQKILECLDREQTYHMHQVNKKLSSLNSKLSHLTNAIPENFIQ